MRAPAGQTDAWFLSNARLCFSGLSDAGQGAVTLGRAEVCRGHDSHPTLSTAAIDLWTVNDGQQNTSLSRGIVADV